MTSRRPVIVSIRLTEAEHATLRRTAERQGQTVSDVIRGYVRQQTRPLPVLGSDDTVPSSMLDWATRMQQTVCWEGGLVDHNRTVNMPEATGVGSLP